MRRAPDRALARVCLVLLGAIAPAALAGCRRADDGAMAEAPSEAGAALHVDEAVITERPMPETLTVTGTLRANQESTIAADASGKVLQVLVERGQIVQRGQVIATLDARSATLSATAAEAQSRVAQSQLDQARRECDRVKHLLDTGAISQAEFDRQTSQCTTQQWSAAAAQAQQQSATKLLGDTRIRSPFDGVIGERLVNVGQYVEPSTKVASLYDADPLRVQLTVPEAELGSIRPDVAVMFTVAAYGDEKFQGVIKYISPNVREASRDLIVEAVVPNHDRRLRPGMFAVAKIQLGAQLRPVAPTSAVARDDTESRVFVVGPDQRVQERLVQLGETVSDVVMTTAAFVAGMIPLVLLAAGWGVREGSARASIARRQVWSAAGRYCHSS